MMASQNQESLLAHLTVALREVAVDLSPEGSAEYAFPVSQAGDVFDLLQAAGVAVLGGDLWQADAEGYGPAHEGWFSDSGRSEDAAAAWRAFAGRLADDPSYYVTFVV
jgi:hypothetical protein